MVSCPNYSLPVYSQIIKLYGDNAGKEIIHKLHENRLFNEWYGDDVTTIPFITNHSIHGSNNDMLDVRDLIVDKRNDYEDYINDMVDSYLLDDISYVELSSLVNNDYIDNLATNLKELLYRYNTSNIEEAINSDISRIKSTSDYLLSKEELTIKYDSKRYKQYYKYSLANDSTFINDVDSLAIYVNDDKLYNLYAYMNTDFHTFKKQVLSLYENC